MASEHFPGIRLKIQRVCDHIELLRDEIATFLDTNPYVPAVKIDGKTGEFAIRMIVKEPCPPMWSVIIGEVLHDLRSALDHSIYELVIHNTGSAPAIDSRTQFPIFGTSSKFDRHCAQMLSGVSKEAATLIRAMQPFDTGEGDGSPLMHLNQLSNIDKHRTIHLTGATLTEFKFSFPPVLADCTIVWEKRGIGAFENDTVFVRGRINSDKPIWRGKVDVNANLRFDIAFDQRTPLVGGWRMHATLFEIANRTHACIQRVSRNIFGKRFDL